MAETETVTPETPPGDKPGMIVRAMPTPLTRPARFAFDNEQLALMKRTVARGADDNAFLMFLELTGRYKLDPFAGQVYLAKMPGRDGEEPTWVTIVSRDGLLTIANRYDDFGGMNGDVIYATDKIARTKEGFVHTYDEIAAEERLKGNIVGAWAMCYRGTRVPTFFLAKFASYNRPNMKKSWGKYPDAMILKCAESMVLRKQFSITGLIPEDEVGARYDEKLGGVIDLGAPIDQEPDWGPDGETAKQLQVAFAEANRIRPGSFLPQKVRLKLAGADDAKRAAILQEVTDFVLRNGGSIPIDAEAVEEPVA
jgi:phage recombination protein Bet